MKDDIANPSIIMAGFGRFDNDRFEKFKTDYNRLGGVVRELKIFEFQIPVDERYTDCANFLKQNINPILRKYMTPEMKIMGIDIRAMIMKQLDEKVDLLEFDYDKFLEHWESSNKYRYGYLGLTPLFIDKKYSKFDIWNSMTPEEKSNYLHLNNGLFTWNFKPLKTPTVEEEVFNDVQED